MSDDSIAASGTWGQVRWAIDSSGRRPAKDFLRSKEQDGPTSDEAAKAWALIGHLADFGHRLAFQADKFKKLGDKAKGDGKDLLELKPSKQIRFLGEFREGREFVIAVGLRKKKDDLRPEDIKRAVRVLGEDRARAKR
ncbi:MAG: hypothetical protein KJ067_23420 [Vicinamibacteria bacterium]|nr:hypothetical protein [Vicinamibacteria bacterium]